MVSTAISPAVTTKKSALGVILDPIADKGLLLSGIITSASAIEHVDPRTGSSDLVSGARGRDAVILIGSAVLHLLTARCVRPT